jgi:hypothetical protein
MTTEINNSVNSEVALLKYQLIAWIIALNDTQLLQEISTIWEKAQQEPAPKIRQFGGGKDMFPYMADDFNEPLEDFKEYMV